VGDSRGHPAREENEQILVNHRRGLANLLAAGLDPFDEAELELLCSTCSGIEDGGRPALEGVHGQGSDLPPHPARSPTNEAGSFGKSPVDAKVPVLQGVSGQDSNRSGEPAAAETGQHARLGRSGRG
jgi:hypothetical protein